MQWRFCPAMFDLHMTNEYVKFRIIPIHRRHTINNKGGTARLWQIAVHEEFVSQELRQVVSKSKSKEEVPDFGYVCSRITHSLCNALSTGKLTSFFFSFTNSP
jgi:hypothetical protein